MLPNKTVAAFIVGLFVLELFAGLATAQGTQPVVGSDVFVADVNYGSPVIGVDAPINITVHNGGTVDFAPPTGWQIFVGFGTGNDCVEPGDGVTDPTGQLAPCYIRMTPTSQQRADGSNAFTVPAGASRLYSLVWHPEPNQRTDASSLFLEIGSIGSTPGQNLTGCQGPDTRCQNDQVTIYGVSVGVLGVTAKPVRAAPEGADKTLNSPWARNQITEPCPDGAVKPFPAVQVGCKVVAGKTIVAEYNVRNTGTVEDTFIGGLPADFDFAKYRNYTISFAPERFSLGKSQSRVVRVTIIVPENETAGNETNVGQASDFVQWSSTRSVTTTTAVSSNCVDDIYCGKNPTLPSFIVDVRHSLNATSNETWREMQVGQTRFFNITLNNTGNADDRFNVSFINETMTINDSWSPIITGAGVDAVGRDGTLVVRKGELKNVTIQVKAPPNATNGTYTWQVRMESLGDAGTGRCKANEVPSVGFCTLTFTAHVAQRWEVAPVLDAAARLVPGEPQVYNIGIENLGNGYDNLSLDLVPTVGGWDARLSERTAHLTPFNTTMFTLTVTSPPNVAPDTQASFYVNATSSGPLDRPIDERRVSIESKMTVIRGPNMRLDAPLNTSFVDAGTNVTFDVRVMNVGNVADNFTIPLPTRPSDWGIEVTPSVNGLGYLELQPTQEGVVQVTLRAPGSAIVGEKATAVVKVVSKSDPTREKSLTLEGRVSGPDLFVDNILVNSTSPYTGDPLEVSVVVGNNGNKAAEKNTTLRLYFVQNGVERVIGEKTYPALAIPGQRRLVEIFTWDTVGVEGPGVILARVDVDDNVPEIDDSAASNERTKPLTLRTFDIKLTPALGLSARPGQSITYGEAPNAFIIEYQGNQPNEPVLIRFESEHGWLSSQSELAVALPRGTPLPILATIDVPTIPGAGRDTLTITVQPQLRPEQTLRATTITNVLDEENPHIERIVATPATAKLGEPVSLDVYLQDATGISSVTAYVVFPTNESQAVVLSKVGEGRWNATRTFTVAGTYRVTAEAADAADPPNVNKTRVTVGTFVLNPGSAPTVKLATDQGTTIRAGTPVRLDIRDPLGVGKVTYSIKGVSYDLRGPNFQIDTSTFAAGPVDVTVTAENIYGVATSAKFALTVDNSPPGISKVTMDPQRPRANEDVTLTIATEANVAGVDVLVKRDGQVVQTLNATRKGASTFVVKFNPPEGDYRIDVTARDSAGNVKIAESAVVFSAKPGSPLPAPSLVLVLAAIGAAMLVLRRRRG
ncbi:MAG TPA: CARDB domain-containing protein [Candidatus Thermoplasmatota archaeon]|nr:CARDB domain-containing protein [Candidatus Thermoplasmatota archaeon]